MSNITPSTDAVLQTLITGDLSRLSSEEKLSYYARTCESLGLNPLTKPFAYIKLSGKETLYATRDCTDQLRKIHAVSIKITARESIGGVYVVTAQASLPGGRCDESTGAVVVDGLRGDNLANAYLKCETKAKRRVTLSICGLGLLDETETDSIRDAVKVADAPVVRLPIMTLGDVSKEHAKELQKALQDDMASAVKTPSIKPAFKVPEGVDLTPKDPGEYVAQIGQPGGKILHYKIKDIKPKDLSDFMKYLRTPKAQGGPSHDFLGQTMVQEFIVYAEEYINLQSEKALEGK